MIINSDYLKHEEENVRNVAIKSCSAVEDNANGFPIPYNNSYPWNRVLADFREITPYNTHNTELRELSHPSLKRDSYIFRIIELPIKETHYYNSAWMRRGVGA